MQRLTSAIRRARLGASLLGLSVLLVPAWAVQTVVQRVGTARQQGTRRDVRLLDAAQVDLAELLETNEPAVVRGLAEQLDLSVTPTVSGLRDLARTNDSTFNVDSFDDAAPFFLYRGSYGKRRIGSQTMTLVDFVPFMFDRPQAQGTCTYRLFNIAEWGGAVGDIIHEMGAQLGSRTSRTPDAQASGIWIGSKGVVTPLHHDAWTGLLFQFSGSKRVLMFSPGDRVNLSFASPFTPRDEWSHLPGRSSEADPEQHPRYAKAIRYETTLHAGEALFIPPYWSHEIEALDANVSIPFRFTTRTKDRFNPGFLTPAAEALDAQFARVRARSAK